MAAALLDAASDGTFVISLDWLLTSTVSVVIVTLSVCRCVRSVKAEAARNAALGQRPVSQEVRKVDSSSSRAIHSEVRQKDGMMVIPIDESDVDQSPQPSAKVRTAAPHGTECLYSVHILVDIYLGCVRFGYSNHSRIVRILE